MNSFLVYCTILWCDCLVCHFYFSINTFCLNSWRYNTHSHRDIHTQLTESDPFLFHHFHSFFFMKRNQYTPFNHTSTQTHIQNIFPFSFPWLCVLLFCFVCPRRSMFAKVIHQMFYHEIHPNPYSHWRKHLSFLHELLVQMFLSSFGVGNESQKHFVCMMCYVCHLKCIRNKKKKKIKKKKKKWQIHRFCWSVLFCTFVSLTSHFESHNIFFLHWISLFEIFVFVLFGCNVIVFKSHTMFVFDDIVLFCSLFAFDIKLLLRTHSHEELCLEQLAAIKRIDFANCILNEA